MNRIVHCRSEADMVRYVQFILTHRGAIASWLDTRMAIYWIGLQLQFGGALLAVTPEERVVGACGYVYGTPEHQFQDKETVQLDLAYIEPAFRGTRLFFHGLTVLVQLLQAAKPAVQRVLFYVPDDKPDLRRLVSRFASEEKGFTSLLGGESRYHVSLEKLTHWIQGGR